MTDSMVPARCRRPAAGLLACVALLTGGSAFAQVAPTVGFSPSVIGTGSASEMTITLENPDSTGATDIQFNNTLPGGTTFVAAPAARDRCRGNLTIAEGGSTLEYDGGRLASGRECTISAYVTGNTSGTHTNVTGDVTSSLGNGGSGAADLTVDSEQARFTKEFSPSTINTGERSRLAYTLENPSASTSMNNLSGFDILPSGLVVASLPNLSTDCKDIHSNEIQLSAEPGDRRIDFFGGFLPPGESCTIALDVAAEGAGTYGSASNPLSSSAGQGGIAAATLTVQAHPIDLVKRFEPAPALPGETATLTYRLRNNSRARAATDLAFTDDLDAALTDLAAAGLPASDVCGAGSTLSGTSVLALSGASLAPGAQCEFTVPVKIPAGASAGHYPSVSSDLTGNLDGVPYSGPGGSAPVFIEASPLLEKAYGESVVGSGGTQNVTYTLTNTSSSEALNNFTFTDEIETVFDPWSSTLPDPGFCNGQGSISTVSPTIDTTAVQASDLNLPAGASCEFEISHVATPTVPSLILGLEPYDATGELDGETVTARVEANTFETASAPAPSLEVLEPVLFPGDEASLRLEMSNDQRGADDTDGSRAYENVALSVDLETALPHLTATGLPLADVCGTGSQLDGESLVSLSDGVLQPGEACAVTMTLQVPASAPPGPVTIESGELVATTGNTTTSRAGATTTLNIANLSVEADFGFEPFGPGEVATATYTLTNNSATSIATDIGFRQILDEHVPGLEAIGLPAADVCGAGSSISGTSTLQLLDGSLAPEESCVFEVQFQLPEDTGGGDAEPGDDVATFTGDYNLLIDAIRASYDGNVVRPAPVRSILRLQAEGEERDLTTGNLVEPNPDGDPIPTEDEEAAGDVNDDGTPDALQSTVASFISPITGRPVSLEVGGDCAAIDHFEIVTAESLGETEEAWRYPEGLASFELPCDSATVTLYFPGAEMPRGIEARKFGPQPPDFEAPGEWYTLPGVTLDEEAGTIQISLNDGELGDSTGVDGIIVDPVGLASPFPPLPEDNGPQAIAIPTLTTGWLALIATALMVMALVALRRTPGKH